MSKPNLTNYTASRLGDYHAFCCLKALDYSRNDRGGRNGRMAWRRERDRVEAEINRRQHVQDSTPVSA